MEDKNQSKKLNKKHKRSSQENKVITEKQKDKKEKKEEKKLEKKKDEEAKEEITEGKATIRLCNKDKTFSAFYNPAQELNRDLTVISIATYFTFSKYLKQKEIKNLSEKKLQ